jgi:hypothetical protein
VSNHISQSEARRLRKRVSQLEKYIESTRSKYSRDYPGGTHLGAVSWGADSDLPSSVKTAKLLGHAVVAVSDGARRFNLYAIPHGNLP